MKKYLYIFKAELMSNLQYIFDLCFGFITYGVIIFIFFNLWQYLYSDPNEVIAGYSMIQMVWYVAATEILWMSLSGRKLCASIVNEVKEGNIVYKINKPYSYIGYIVSNHLGLFTLRFIIYVFFAIILGFILLGSLPNLSVISVIFAIVSAILATIISILLITSIGLLSFFIEDANPIYWIYSKIILVIGTLFPVEIFPEFLQPIVICSPIYVTSYGPAKLFVDFNYSNLGSILLAQGTYLVISYLIVSFLYKKGVKRLNVNGG